MFGTRKAIAELHERMNWELKERALWHTEELAGLRALKECDAQRKISVQALRDEVDTLRKELQGLRFEVRRLHELVRELTPEQAQGKSQRVSDTTTREQAQAQEKIVQQWENMMAYTGYPQQGGEG
jgi:polyhydroxyalkanoate synthesis regulator phasin